MNIIEADQLTYTYPRTSQAVLQDLSFEIPAGCVTTLLGGRGAGKSTLCLVLAGIAPGFYGGEWLGRLRVGDVEVNAEDARLSDVVQQVAIALLMSNQTPFEVEQALTPLLTELARPFEPEMIVGIPTMGLDYARSVAKALGLTRYVALGTSCKFCYDKELSVAVESITSPGQKKFLYIDPALVERVAGKRTLIVDDVVSTGGTTIAAIQLLQKVGVNVAGLVVALTEGNDWKSNLQTLSSDWANRVRSLGHIPLFQRQDAGWIPIPATEST